MRLQVKEDAVGMTALDLEDQMVLGHLHRYLEAIGVTHEVTDTYVDGGTLFVGSIRTPCPVVRVNVPLSKLTV